MTAARVPRQVRAYRSINERKFGRRRTRDARRRRGDTSDHRFVCRQCARVLRDPGLRLFRRDHFQGVLSRRQRSRLAFGHAGYVRYFVSRAPGRRDLSRRLRGPQRTQESADALYSSDDDWHRLDDGDAKLWFGRIVGADTRHCRAAPARILGGRRVRELDRLSGRTSAGPRRIFCKLAVVEPRFCRAGGDRFGRFADNQHVRRHAAGVGLADPVRRGPLDWSGRLLHPQPARTKRQSLSKRERREGRSAIYSSASGIGFS